MENIFLWENQINFFLKNINYIANAENMGVQMLWSTNTFISQSLLYHNQWHKSSLFLRRIKIW